MAELRADRINIMWHLLYESGIISVLLMLHCYLLIDNYLPIDNFARSVQPYSPAF